MTDPTPSSDTPAHSGRDGLTLREAAIEAILIREQDTAFSVVARHIAALFTLLDAIPPTCPTATCHGCPDPEACEALRPTPVPEASGRPGEMVFTQGSPRPALQVLVSLTDGRPCVDAVSMLAFFRDSAAWNEVAGDPEKVAGLRAAADAMWELHGKAKAHLHASAPSSSPVGDRVPSVHLLLDIWQALGGDSEAFHPWWAADPSFPDRWSQIVAAVAGNISGLAADTNPPAGALLDIAIQFGAADRGEPT